MMFVSSRSSRFVVLSLAFTVCGLARADEAYSNFTGTYYNGGYFVDPSQTLGFQFASATTGSLTGFTLAVNNRTSAGPLSFTLSLYDNSTSDELGSLLASYSGLSTGEAFNSTHTALVNVVATGNPIGLSAGSKYWLVASSNELLAWNYVDYPGGPNQPFFFTQNGASYYNTKALSSAFSVQVTPVPEPATFAVLGAGALLRRRRRF